MNAKVVCIVHQKGGVAKTTTACTLAHALTRAGQKVLLIDLDPQGQDAIFFGLEPESGAANFIMTSVDDARGQRNLEAWVLESGRENLALIAGNEDTATAQIYLYTPRPKPVSYIRGQLRPFMRRFDYILFDTSPSVGGVQEGAAWAADLVLIPTATEFAAQVALANTLDLLQVLTREKGWQGQLFGILPTFYDTTTLASRKAKKSLEESFEPGLILPAIHRATILRECWLTGTTIFEKDPQARPAKEYQVIANMLMRLGHARA